MMTRLILPFLAAFAIAVVGGSALVLVRAKDAHSAALLRFAELKAKADSTRPPTPATADSAGHAARDSVAHAAPPPNAPVPVIVPPPGKPGPTALPVPSTAPAPSPRPDGPAVPTGDGRTPTPAVEAAQDVGAEKRLSKIFASMAPKDAAKVLQQMDDADVRVILGHLGPRQAAAVLGNFPAERAATLSQQQLKGPMARGGKP